MNHNRYRALMLAVCMWALALGAAAPGMASTPITNIQQLQVIALNGDYELANDIDAMGFVFIPIGNTSTPFTGKLNGKGFIIRNLSIQKSTENYIGLFGCVGSAGDIKDVRLADATVSGSNHVGGLVGKNDGGTITSCYSTGSVSGSEKVGGLVGLNYSGSITTSWSSAAVSGHVSGTGSDTMLGGLVGGNYTTVTSCYSTGAVAGKDQVGGLAGYNESTITASYSTGAVSVTATNFGGLVGKNSSGTYNNCFWDTQTSGTASPGSGKGQTTAEMKAKSTFPAGTPGTPGWNFNTVWGICEGHSYPFLRWFYESTPIAAADTYSTLKNTTLSVTWPNVLANDSSPDCDELSVELASTTAHGSLVLFSDGKFNYTPNTGFSGLDSFTYKASDGKNKSAAATVLIAVGNSAPVANSDSYSTGIGTLLTVTAASGVLKNDTDPDNDAPLSAVLATTVLHGSLVFNASGSFSYTPAAGYRGTDSFTYSASDGMAVSPLTTVIITVGSNTPPVTAADTYCSPKNQALVVPAPGVLGNDTDADNNILAAVLVSSAAHGSVALNQNGSFTYIPDDGFTGTDTFTYKTSDGMDESAAAPVTVTVTSHAITAAPDSYSVEKNTTLEVDQSAGVLANDTDELLHSLSVLLVTGPVNGTVFLSTDGSFIYTPNNEFTGVDSFTYKDDDGAEDTATAKVTINVNKNYQLTVSPIKKLLSVIFPFRLITLSVASGDAFPADPEIAWGTDALKTMRIRRTDQINTVKVIVKLKPLKLDKKEYQVSVGGYAGTLQVQ